MDDGAIAGRELAHDPAFDTLDIYGDSRQSDDPKGWRIVHGGIEILL